MNTSKRNSLLLKLTRLEAQANFRKRGVSPYDITRVNYALAAMRYSRAIRRVLEIAPSAGRVDYSPRHNPRKSLTVLSANPAQAAYEQDARFVKASLTLGRHIRRYGA